MERSKTSPENGNSSFEGPSDKRNSGKRTNDSVEVTSLFDLDVNVLAEWREFERVTSDDGVPTDGGESTRCARVDESYILWNT